MVQIGVEWGKVAPRYLYFSQNSRHRAVCVHRASEVHLNAVGVPRAVGLALGRAGPPALEPEDATRRPGVRAPQHPPVARPRSAGRGRSIRPARPLPDGRRPDFLAAELPTRDFSKAVLPRWVSWASRP